ncbi:hypothetical protein HK096_006646 [Nowakowskiella sp. JEL0078]|nr:hypothetical protein HK096_006646 [Nowakowskiella sp. JEL0078]
MQDDSEELDDAKEIEEDENFVQVIQKEPEVCTCFIEEKADLAHKQLEAEEAYAEYCKKYWIWFKANENLNDKVVDYNIQNQCNLSTPEAILETAIKGLWLKILGSLNVNNQLGCTCIFQGIFLALLSFPEQHLLELAEETILAHLAQLATQQFVQ